MFRKFLSGLPQFLFTGIVVIAILWLTLAPRPLGENPPPLFPGADKLAHAIMFGGLASMILLDWQRSHRWKKVSTVFAIFAAILSSLFGISIEYIQAAMHLGRGFEYTDMLADTIGAFLAAILWIVFQKFWLPMSTD